MPTSNLIKINLKLFRLLKKGDCVYYAPSSDGKLLEFKIIYAKWEYSGDLGVVSSKTLKPFWYYQISFKNDIDVRHFDSISCQFDLRPIYITKELFETLLKRKKR